MTSNKILLHICCGPCAIYPVKVLREKGIQFTGFFFNPNIHPFREYEQRVQALEEIKEILNFSVVFHPKGYDFEEWLKEVTSAGLERPKRCHACYSMRLIVTALEAKRLGFKVFSTTLLYSVYQDHQAIKQISEKISEEIGIEFFYEDFREGWKEGKDEARRIGIYMQPYCGCIISEKERYQKRIDRMKKRFKEEYEAYESIV
ncbi:Diacylglucosamine hydrolase like [Dissulfuribacter thermophilus]|uniref:Epoxyqueuosine reductase QueH n=1 Tax=Dissulfuribacter thermophilus TaxID=1156395 RepID=A0A1B9F378_9BACT|nr:epoxyqueuosine reductase QueH [Dissulfuribacter thermophilus]OCC14386.1 Diacylglucosamine hydrolase like [Dissulfuribacter thermophilus]